MKKFGTPIGAGPGSDSENVGLLAVGTPLPLGRADPVLPDFGVDARFLRLALARGLPLDDGCSLRPDPVGEGLELVEELDVVDVLLLLEELEDDDPELEVELEGEVVVELDVLDEAGELGVVVLLVVVVVELDDELVVQTGVSVAATGSGSPVAAMICATVAPAGTGTATPVDGIVTEQVSSAAAVGRATSAIIPIKTALALRNTATSFRRLITAALLL
jgi:hypothetical protein